MVGHAHSISLSLSLSVCLDWPRSFSDKNDISPCLSPIRPIHIVYSLTHIVYLGHSLQPVSLFRSHGDPMWSVDLASSHAQNISTRLWLDHLSSSILQPSPLPKSSIGQYLSRAYIFVQWMSDHTHFVSLSICLSIDLAFSHRIFHALKLLPLHPSQSRSYLHCEGHSNLGLICVGIYSGRFRLYFRSIRPTTTPNTVATHATPLVDFPLARSSLSRTSFLTFNVAPWYYWKNYVVLFNYYK